MQILTAALLILIGVLLFGFIIFFHELGHFLAAKGLGAPGFGADLVLVDIDHMFTVDAAKLHSKSKNCPYDGQSFYGKIMLTLKAGKETYRSPEFAG